LMSLRNEVFGQIRIVVNFAVEDDRNRAVFVEDRLTAATHVNDAEASVSESGVAVDKVAVIVGAAMGLSGRHSLEYVRIYGVSCFEIDDPADPAHKPFLPLHRVR